jgi:hypothetical protein
MKVVVKDGLIRSLVGQALSLCKILGVGEVTERRIPLGCMGGLRGDMSPDREL